MLRVKICGITNPDDALDSIKAGADAIGFVFAPSKRQVQAQKAKDIVEKIPPWIATVGVFQDEAADKIHELKAYCKFTWVQLHGNENGSFAAQFYPYVIKAIWDPKDVLEDYPCRAFLLDQNKEAPLPDDQFFKLAAEVKSRKPLILAGSLTPENVERAKALNLYGVDVARGVESSPGKKNPDKVTKFIARAKGLI